MFNILGTEFMFLTVQDLQKGKLFPPLTQVKNDILLKRSNVYTEILKEPKSRTRQTSQHLFGLITETV